MKNIQNLIREIVTKIITEKKLTTAEKKKKEDIVKGMKKDFKGPKSDMYAIATNKAKKLAEDNQDIKDDKLNEGFKESQEINESLVRKWQYYAGIK